MKKILIIFLCLIFYNNVNGLECKTYLTGLEIDGYTYTPFFNKYNNYYSVTIPNDLTSLKLNYSVGDKNTKVLITGNDPLTEEINIVLNCNQEEEIYTIYVNKEIDQEVFLYLPVTENEFSTKDKLITIGIIGFVALFMFVCIGYFLFKKRRINDKLIK